VSTVTLFAGVFVPMPTFPALVLKMFAPDVCQGPDPPGSAMANVPRELSSSLD
jgi:hypothetical protein